MRFLTSSSIFSSVTFITRTVLTIPCVFTSELYINTEIAIENKKKQVKETQIEAQRAIQQKQNRLKGEQMQFETELEKKRADLIELTVQNAKVEADAKAYELSSVMKALEGINPNVIQSLASIGMQPSKLIALPFQELAEKAGQIGQLTITPDLLQELMREPK